MTEEPISIRFRGVTKQFRLDLQGSFMTHGLLRRLFRAKTSHRIVTALSDVSFEIAPGESVGVVGPNGSGKSTLLSLMAGTSYAAAGTVEVVGKVGALLELGAGFHPMLTGRENIVLNAALLGMTREQIEARTEDIIEFSELRDFIDGQLSTYSNGMVARLGFSVLAYMEPDVLLIDEALSVGDARFASKCEQTIDAFLRGGATVVIVSHDLPSIERLCKRALWIDGGRLRADGSSHDVCVEYWNEVERSRWGEPKE